MKIYVDFDNTIVDSVAAFVTRYNQLNGTKYQKESVVKYDFSNLITNIAEEELVRGFHSNFFFNELSLYENVKESLVRLKHNGAELILITRGTLTNIQKKIEWLDKHHWIKDLFSDFIFLTSTQDVLKIDMSQSILIDDLRVNHLNCNAKYKYCYKDQVGRDWYPIPDDGVHIFTSWNLIAEDILKLLKKSSSTSSTSNKNTTSRKRQTTTKNSNNTRKHNKNNTKSKGGD